MTVIDVPRVTIVVPGEAWPVNLVVPPFHVGPLGLGPWQRLVLHAPRSRGDVGGAAGSDLYFTPFAEHLGEMFTLSVDLLSSDGVARLLRALAELGINTVKQESVVVDYGRVLRMSLLLEWPSGASSHALASDRRRYAPMSVRMNMADGRYVALYEALMRQCGSVLAFDDSFGSPLPSIDARPIAQPPRDEHIRMFTDVRTTRGLPSALKQSAAVMAGSVRIPLPNDIVELLRAQSGQVGEHLTYVLSSDLEKRALNVFVPDGGALARFVHVGFRGLDRPGTLATAAALLDKAEVSVVTSVQRNELVEESTMCVWEVVADDPGGCHASAAVTMQERRDDLAVRLRALVAQDTELAARSATARLAVVPPRYRHPADLASPQEAVDLWTAPASHMVLPGDTQSFRYGLSVQRWPGREFRRLFDRIGVQFSDPSAKTAARQLLLAAHAGSTRTTAKPSIFLSYPSVARPLAQVLMNDRDLRSHFQFVDFQTPEAICKKDGARLHISGCDYFLALWHPDIDCEPRSLSPWSAWESGIAAALGIPSHHLISKRADDRYAVYRIDSNYTAIPYGDVARFAVDVLPRVRRCLINDWGSPIAPRTTSRRRSAA